MADSRAKFAKFPQNTVVELHNSNHYVFLQRPAEVALAMRSFLETRRIVRQPVLPQPVEPHDTTNHHTRAAGRR